MSNLIQDKILALAPAATVKEGEVLTVTVPAENFHAVAQMLRDDKEMQFDCLVCVTGADWGETPAFNCAGSRSGAASANR